MTYTSRSIVIAFILVAWTNLHAQNRGFAPNNSTTADSISLIAPPDDSEIINLSRIYAMTFVWHEFPRAGNYVFSIRNAKWDSTIDTPDTSLYVLLNPTAGPYFSWSVSAEVDSETVFSTTRTLHDLDTPAYTVQPSDGAENVPTPVLFSWIAPLDNYGLSWSQIVVATDSQLTQIVVRDTQFTGNSVKISLLRPSTKYYWAAGVNGMMWHLSNALWIWTDTAMFTTGNYAGVRDLMSKEAQIVGQLEIYDVLGRRIYRGAAERKPPLPRGFYFERIDGNVAKVWIP